jgi:hypothetical protein
MRATCASRTRSAPRRRWVPDLRRRGWRHLSHQRGRQHAGAAPAGRRQPGVHLARASRRRYQRQHRQHDDGALRRRPGGGQRHGSRCGAPPSSPRSAGQTTITLQSDAGDFVGQGASYAYTRADAVLSFSPSGGTCACRCAAMKTGTASSTCPVALTQFQPGTYTNLTRAPFRNPAVAGSSGPARAVAATPSRQHSRCTARPTAPARSVRWT